MDNSISNKCFGIVWDATIGGSHQLISSDVIDLMGQLIDLIYYCQFC